MNYSHVRVNERYLTIASIFPLECRETRDFGPNPETGGRTTYVLPAVKEKGKFVTLKVYDAFQRTQDFMNCQPGKPAFMPFPVFCGDIASDLIRHWVDARIGGSSGFRPGIMVIEGDEPTAAELASMDKTQRGYFEFLFHEGQREAAAHHWENITDLHREAARYLGLQAPWVAEIGSSQRKNCVACFEPIHPLATKCKVCLSDQPGAESKPGKPTIAPPLKPPAGHSASL